MGTAGSTENRSCKGPEQLWGSPVDGLAPGTAQCHGRMWPQCLIPGIPRKHGGAALPLRSETPENTERVFYHTSAHWYVFSKTSIFKERTGGEQHDSV